MKKTSRTPADSTHGTFSPSDTEDTSQKEQVRTLLPSADMGSVFTADIFPASMLQANMVRCQGRLDT